MAFPDIKQLIANNCELSACPFRVHSRRCSSKAHHFAKLKPKRIPIIITINLSEYFHIIMLIINLPLLKCTRRILLYHPRLRYYHITHHGTRLPISLSRYYIGVNSHSNTYILHKLIANLLQHVSQFQRQNHIPTYNTVAPPI